LSKQNIFKKSIFHELIYGDELTRCGSVGVSCLLNEGIVLGLPPVMAFGSETLKKKYVKSIIQGEKIICLAITEPTAGSDVIKFYIIYKR
jgi:alkylation response protein AidB-like acyl-CoA dehydrogenase